MNFELKFKLLDNIKKKEFEEKKEELSDIDNKINEIIETINKYEGYSLKNLEYIQLSEIENNLLILFVKTREKINILEQESLNNHTQLETLTKCKIC